MNAPCPPLPIVAVIEDDDDLRANLLLTLQGMHFPSWGAASAEEFYRERAISPAEIVLIDLGLPGEDGLSVLRHLRQDSNLGIIVVTARGCSESRIASLESGADHYFIKPFDMRELIAAISSLARRMAGRSGVSVPKASAAPKRSDEAWALEPTALMLRAPNGQSVQLSEREYKLLAELMAAEGVVVSKLDLHAAVFSDMKETDLHRVDVIISRLRDKSLSRLGLQIPLRTIFGKGFVFFEMNQTRI